MILFDTPLNYRELPTDKIRTSPAEVGDNRFDTISTERTITAHIDSVGDGSGTSRQYTHIFIKSIGAHTDFTISGIQSGFVPPIEGRQDRFGNVIEVASDGFHNNLIPLADFGAPLTAKTVTLIFAGNVSIVEVMILNEVIDFTDMEYNGQIRYEIDENPIGTIQRGITKRSSYLPPIADERDKVSVATTIRFGQGETQRDAYFEFEKFRRTHRAGFTMAVDPVFFPHLVFPAMFDNVPRTIRYPSRWKGAGRRVRFTTIER